MKCSEKRLKKKREGRLCTFSSEEERLEKEIEVEFGYTNKRDWEDGESQLEIDYNFSPQYMSKKKRKDLIANFDIEQFSRGSNGEMNIIFSEDQIKKEKLSTSNIKIEEGKSCLKEKEEEEKEEEEEKSERISNSKREAKKKTKEESAELGSNGINGINEKDGIDEILEIEKEMELLNSINGDNKISSDSISDSDLDSDSEQQNKHSESCNSSPSD